MTVVIKKTFTTKSPAEPITVHVHVCKTEQEIQNDNYIANYINDFKKSDFFNILASSSQITPRNFAPVEEFCPF